MSGVTVDIRITPAAPASPRRSYAGPATQGGLIGGMAVWGASVFGPAFGGWVGAAVAFGLGLAAAFLNARIDRRTLAPAGVGSDR